jgi:hypothetical protein
MIGNGCTDWDDDVDPSMYEVFYHFNMMPKHLFDEYNSL